MARELEKDEYIHDSSDEEDVVNTVGNVPQEWYKNADHIGYDVKGRRIVKPSAAARSEVERFLENMESGDNGRTVVHPVTGQQVFVTDEDIKLVRNILTCRVTGPSFDDDEDFMWDWFTRETMETPISSHPPQKSSYVPPKHEKDMVSRFVYAIKMGRMKKSEVMPTRQDYDNDAEVWNSDIPDYWGPYDDSALDEKLGPLREFLPKGLQFSGTKIIGPILRAPPMPLPTHADSYKPPPEYLYTDEERKKVYARFFDRSYNPHRHADEKPYIPKVFENLRSVPFSPQFIVQTEKRLRDKLHGTRMVKNVVNTTSEKILEIFAPPKIDMRPYPEVIANRSLVHDVILSMSVSHDGNYLAIIGYEMIQIFETDTKQCSRQYPIVISDKKDLTIRNPCVCWNPMRPLLLVAIDNKIMVINPGLEGGEEANEQLQVWYKAAQCKFLADEDEPMKEVEPPKESQKANVNWSFSSVTYNGRLRKQLARIEISEMFPVLDIDWHPSGDYFLTVSGTGRASNSGGALRLHRLSEFSSMSPFVGIKCLTARFHRQRRTPWLFVVQTDSSYVRVFDLAKRETVRELQVSGDPSSIVVHPRESHLVVGTFQGSICWFDLDMGNAPYKVINLGLNSIRSLALHNEYPLLCCGTANGSVTILFAKVFDSLDKNPILSPVERFEKIDKSKDVYAVAFHLSRPIAYCGGSSKLLFTLEDKK